MQRSLTIIAGILLLTCALSGCIISDEPGGTHDNASGTGLTSGAGATDIGHDEESSRGLDVANHIARTPDSTPDRDEALGGDDAPGSARGLDATRAAPAAAPDLSVSDACEGENGGFDFCAPACPCDSGQGDCDSDDDCAPGLACMRDTGGLFGFDPEIDMCLEQCTDVTLGTPDHCSPGCPCEHGEGDCDEDEDCASGSVCKKNVGASFGFAADVDVCIDLCSDFFNGSFDYCTPSCPCSHGQGDCDSDDDCAPGHACTNNVGADHGFPADMDVCVATAPPEPELVELAGRVLDHRNRPVAELDVAINGASAQTDADGAFTLTLDPAADDRYVINIHADGFVPVSQIHVGLGANDLAFQLQPVQVIAFDHTQPVDVEDDSNTRLVLPANALVDAQGNPPKGPVTVQMHTYDILNETMVGDMEAVDVDGNPVMLESVGAVSADFVGTDGTRYQLAPGQTAQIAVELPEGVTYSGPIPMWYYDTAQGRWIEEGVGMVQDGVAVGVVSHFSVWNFDVKRADPACVQVTVPIGLAPFGTSIQARVVVGPPLPTVRNVSLQQGLNAFYNLPPDTDVQIFVPPSATAPLATVNTGAPWGARGQPLFPYDDCNGRVTLPNTIPGQLVGIATLEGRKTHAGITVEVRDAGGAVVGTATTDELGRYIFEVPAGDYSIELGHPNFLPVRFDAMTVPSGKNLLMSCVQLLAGDVDADGDIDSGDLDAILARQGTSASPGDPVDLDGNSFVDRIDLAIANRNLNLAGPVSADDTRSDCAPPEVATSNIAAGGEHTCVVQEGGQVRCWGANQVGQLGYGHTSNIGDDELLVFAGPVDVGGPVRSLAAGRYHTCALLETGALRCWGQNGNGQLGYGHTRHIGDNETPASAGDVDVGGRVVQLAAGVWHTCALLETGALRCWGQNTYGQLGYGHTSRIGDNETPASAGDVDVGGRVVQIQAGTYHTCALLETGALRCWGYNWAGQLGYGHTDRIGDNETPASAGDIDLGGPAIQVQAGHGHTCALLETGALRCWGYNVSGQLGYGHTRNIGDNEAPASAGDIDLGGPAIQIQADNDHTCALLEAGTLRCWGNNGNGQLGYGHTNRIGDNETPAAAGDAAVGGRVIQVATGYWHTCAQMETGTIRCWGANWLGQLGYGNTSQIGDNETPASVGDVPFL